jgi:Flp pilus assembly protein TadD
MKTLVVTALLALGVVAPVARAAETETTAPADAENPDYQAGRTAVERKDWPAAVASFRKVVAAEPTNADGYNMLGFSLRWMGRMDEAFAAYDRALAINPQHRGALEYSGVAYLKAGKPARAQEQLARLEKIGARSSEEYRDLAKAIADYNAGKR